MRLCCSCTICSHRRTLCVPRHNSCELGDQPSVGGALCWQAKLQSSGVEIKELQASLAESERDRVRLQAQVDTLGQLLVGTAARPDPDVPELQHEVVVRPRSDLP